jgi:hypothetical protein
MTVYYTVYKMSDSEEEKTVMIKVVLPDSIRHEFKIVCVKNKTNMNSVLVEFIQKYVSENKKSES